MGGRVTRIGLIVAATLYCGADAALAQSSHPTTPRRADDDGPPQPPKHRLFYNNLFALRYNPLGAFEEFRFSYRYRLYDHKHRAFRDNFAGVGVVPGVSPAFLRLGVFAEVQPASFFLLTAQYEAIRYFGAFRVMQSFPDAAANFSDTELRRLADVGGPGRPYVTTGSQLTIAALLQFKFGPIAFRSNTRIGYVDMSLRAGDTVYYDILYDMLVQGRGWLVTNDTDVLWVSKFGLAAGLRYSIGHAFYDPQNVGRLAGNDNVPIQRVGPFFAYTFHTKAPGSTMFNNPTVILLAQWWLSHRFRTGQDVSQGVPLIGIAFTFNGDFWSK
jgi:hypothetical protein